MKFEDLPREIKQGMEETSREQLGSGYVPDYYRQHAMDWLWLYEAGVKVGKEAKARGEA